MTTPAPIGVVAHYNLLERLDPAGPGDLYRARDTRLGRTVVLRFLPAGFTADSAAYVEQARSLIPLSHPNITTVFDAGEHDGRVYVVFEFLRGQSLRGEIAGRQMNVRRSMEIAIQIADAIAEAHGAGFLHRGLSPESVVITAKGHAKIPTLELAARGGFIDVDGQSRLGDYESPEEGRGEPPDERSDVYSVGAVLFEMLTTRRPMHRGSAAPSASNTHVPPELDQIVLKAVAPNPGMRQQSAASLAAELRSVLAIVDVRGGAGDDEPIDTRQSSPTRLLIIALLLVAAVVGIVLWVTRS